MAQAVQELFPGTQVTIGPAIEDGFYYDFAREEPFSPDDLATIEARMQEIVGRDLPIEREVWGREDAKRTFADIGETFKVEIIEDVIPENEEVSAIDRAIGSTFVAGRIYPALANYPRLSS